VFGGGIAAVRIVDTTDPGAAQLVKEAQHGDTSAFAQLYQRYAGMVHLIAMSRLPSDEIADVVQETFLRALCRIKSLRVAEAFGPWLSSIARNIVSTWSGSVRRRWLRTKSLCTRRHSTKICRRGRLGVPFAPSPRPIGPR